MIQLTEAKFRNHATPGSSNVHSFQFAPGEGSKGERRGTLYVTFLGISGPKGSRIREGIGPTYAYFGVPALTYTRFRQAANGRSAGKAVWSYLRVRKSRTLHQFPYAPAAFPFGGVPADLETSLTQECGAYRPTRKKKKRKVAGKLRRKTKLGR